MSPSVFSKKNLAQIVVPFALALTAFSANVLAADVDVDAAQAVLKKNNCTKCHSVDKDKTGPSFKKTAATLKGKPDAEATLIKHLTTGPMVKVDGVEEKHKIVKVENDASLKNLVQYILTR